MKEFKPIPMLYNLYEISSDGKTFRRGSTKKELKISEGANYGYSLLVLTINRRYPEESILYSHPKSHHAGYYKDGKEARQITLKVHQLVYDAFIGPIPEGMVIDHIDRNKLNNDVSNLRAVTQSENQHNSDQYKGVWGYVMVSWDGGSVRLGSKEEAIRYVSERTGKSYRTVYNAVYSKGSYGGFTVTRLDNN